MNYMNYGTAWLKLAGGQEYIFKYVLELETKSVAEAFSRFGLASANLWDLGCRVGYTGAVGCLVTQKYVAPEFAHDLVLTAPPREVALKEAAETTLVEPTP